MFTCSVTGIREAIAANGRLISPRMHDVMIEDVVNDTCSLIRQRCPVDTGALLNTIHYEKHGLCDYIIIIGDENTPYVIPMEFGFSGYVGGTPENPRFMKTGYCPFIRSSVYEINQLFNKYLKTHILMK